MKQFLKNISLLLLTSLIAVQVTAEILWIDVRSEREYKADYIDGDVNISHQKIAAEIANYASSKETTINLYCASGGRAKQAKQTLEQLGYTDVINRAGINDVRAMNELLSQ